MIPTVDEATVISHEAITAGATAIADAFGLGDTNVPSTDWPIDDGDSVLGATLGGSIAGTLLLAVNDDVAARLSSDSGRLRSGFQRALDAIVDDAGIAGEIEIVEIGASTITPLLSVELHDGKQMCALFGFAPAEAEEDQPIGDSPAESQPASARAPIFEPAALAGDGNTVATPSLGPLTLLQEVEMDVTVELGRTRMPIRELLALQPGMVVEIDRVAGTPIDVLVNGRAIACGEVVVIDEEFGIRITEIIDSGARL